MIIGKGPPGISITASLVEASQAYLTFSFPREFFTFSTSCSKISLSPKQTWLICKRQLLNFYYIILMAQSTKSNFIKHTQIYRSFNWLGLSIFQFDLLATGDYLFILATSRIRIGALSWWPAFDLLLPIRVAFLANIRFRESRFSHFGLSRQLLSTKQSPGLQKKCAQSRATIADLWKLGDFFLLFEITHGQKESFRREISPLFILVK